MKHYVMAAVVGLLWLGSMAQPKAEIEVSYMASSPSFKSGSAGTTHRFVLLANGTCSKFYSPKTEFVDSLKSTPQGESQYREASTAAFMSGKMDKMPRRDGSYYVVKSLSEGTVTTYDEAGLERYVISEPAEEWQWQVSDSVKDVLGIECVMATTDFHGRRWTAWFAPELPLQNGPWKLGGLPGLILEAEAEGGQYSFVADGIQLTSRPITDVYLADEYEPVSRTEFLEAKRSFIGNPLGQINALLGVTVKVNDGKGETLKYVPREEVDFIETDY